MALISFLKHIKNKVVVNHTNYNKINHIIDVYLLAFYLRGI